MRSNCSLSDNLLAALAICRSYRRLAAPRMEVEAMTYLLALVGMPVLVLAASHIKFLPLRSMASPALLSFCLLYAFIVGSAQLAGRQIEQELYTYDLDGNGSFSQDEISLEAEAAMDRFSNDTGRTFAPITGFIFSLIYVTLFFGVVKLVKRYVFRKV